ncbi:hypothetical protein EV44_g3335 [Erysiphe necator]|uniref:Uncharacterized protein n=1 Tax=Uncinula necator TaxID=52586 RepID=A0A0B1PAY7_UNCNE|nr:hypothetical protein EV44_g3335 [Erysiphe necator]
MEVVKPLYGMAEAGTHWWAIYLKHQQEKLRMETSTFDPCLLVTSRENINFGIVRMQIDDTIILADEGFSVQEEERLLEAEFLAKSKERLTVNTPLDFTGCTLTSMNDSNCLQLKQKGQGNKIELINVTDENF